jgi:hypothetical protein
MAPRCFSAAVAHLRAHGTSEAALASVQTIEIGEFRYRRGKRGRERIDFEARPCLAQDRHGQWYVQSAAMRRAELERARAAMLAHNEREAKRAARAALRCACGRPVLIVKTCECQRCYEHRRKAERRARG